MLGIVHVTSSLLWNTKREVYQPVPMIIYFLPYNETVTRGIQTHNPSLKKKGVVHTALCVYS